MYIYIYIYIDLLLVALIISAGYSEGLVAWRLQQAQFSIQILQKFLGFRILLELQSKKLGPQKPRNCSGIEANGTTKAELLPRSSKSHHFSKFTGFLIKFASKTQSKQQQRWDTKFHGFRSNFGLENRPKNVPVTRKRIS